MRDRLTHAFDEFIDLSDQSDRYIANQIQIPEYRYSGRSDGLHIGRAWREDFRTTSGSGSGRLSGICGNNGCEFCRLSYRRSNGDSAVATNALRGEDRLSACTALCRTISRGDRFRTSLSFDPTLTCLRMVSFFVALITHTSSIRTCFRVWMTIMKATDGSVLWLSELHESAQSNLRKEAEAAGVDPRRLIFAKLLASAAEHLARHQLADLFLDTTPYNAHTTASDALWGGLPVLTRIGEPLQRALPQAW